MALGSGSHVPGLARYRHERATQRRGEPFDHKERHRTKVRIEWPDGRVEVADEPPTGNHGVRSVLGGDEVLVVPGERDGRCVVLVIDLRDGSSCRPELPGSCSQKHHRPPGANEKVFVVEGERTAWTRVGLLGEVELDAASTEGPGPLQSVVHRQVDGDWLLEVVNVSESALEIRVIHLNAGEVLQALPMSGEVTADPRLWAHRAGEVKCFAAGGGENSRVRCLDLTGDASRWLLDPPQQVPGAVVHMQHHTVAGRAVVIGVTVTRPDVNGEVFTFATAFDPGREQPLWQKRWPGQFAAAVTRDRGDYKAFALQTYAGTACPSRPDGRVGAGSDYVLWRPHPSARSLGLAPCGRRQCTTHTFPSVFESTVGVSRRRSSRPRGSYRGQSATTVVSGATGTSGLPSPL